MLITFNNKIYLYKLKKRCEKCRFTENDSE